MKSNIIDIEGWQYHATDKAILFWTDETSREMAVWLPRSQAKTSEIYTKGADRRILAADGMRALENLKW